MCGVVDVVVDVVQKLLAVTMLRDDDDLSKNVTSISVVGICKQIHMQCPWGHEIVVS